MDDEADLKGRLHVRNSLSTTESTLLASLSERGRNIFTLEDVTSTLDIPYEYAKVIVSRLGKKKWLIRLARGKYIIVPLEAGVRSQHTEHGFVIASHLVEPYYIGYWSALNYHGLSEQVPSAIFVVSSKRRKDRTILDTRFRFVTIKKSKMFELIEVNISNSEVKISGVEKTVADCLDHPEYCGGLEEIAKALFFEHRELDMKKVIENADEMGNKTIIKRLGYLLDLFEYHEYEHLFKDVKLSKGYPKLDPKLPEKGTFNDRWRLLINVDISPGRWMR